MPRDIAGVGAKASSRSEDETAMPWQAHRAYIFVRRISASIVKRSVGMLCCMAIFFPAVWAQASEMVEVRGRVSASNIERLAELMDQNLDGEIYLWISVKKSTSEEEDVQADADDGRLVLYKKSGESEIVVRSGFRLVGGDYVLGGIYRIKSGGVHQGVASYSVQLSKDSRTGRKRKSGLKVVCLDDGASGNGSAEKHRECR